jgi:hypothetical protein
MNTAFVEATIGPVALALMLLAACGGGGGSPPPVTVGGGGRVSGLAGSGLVLAANGSDHLAVSGNGSFTFANKVRVSSTYKVSVLTQPTKLSQTCVVANGSGQAGGSDVTNVTVACTTNTYTTGGAISGLTGSAIQLSYNGIDTLALNNDGTFVFPSPVASGSAYKVTITAQPPDLTQHCTVSNGIGTVGGADVANLAVRCAKVGRFVYIQEVIAVGVLAYAVDATTGAFQAVAGSPFATDKCPCSVSVTPDARFAYVGSGGTLYPYLIDSVTGALSAAGAGTNTGSGSIGIDPQSKFAYVSDPAVNTISAYAIDERHADAGDG